MRLLVSTALVAALLAAPGAAGAGREGERLQPARRPVKVAGRQCAEAGRAIIDMPTGFDRVRVIVADAVPGAEVDVTVLAGAADRRVRARGGGDWSLAMDATAPGPVLVAIEPSLDAPVGACVERVQLLRDARVVADLPVR